MVVVPLVETVHSAGTTNVLPMDVVFGVSAVIRSGGVAGGAFVAVVAEVALDVAVRGSSSCGMLVGGGGGCDEHAASVASKSREKERMAPFTPDRQARKGVGMKITHSSIAPRSVEVMKLVLQNLEIHATRQGKYVRLEHWRGCKEE